jgi:hypothetical protein
MVQIVLVGDDIRKERRHGSCNCLFAVIISSINNYIILIKSHASSILLFRCIDQGL